MYTEDYVENRELNNDDNYIEPQDEMIGSFWDNNKSLITKILSIVLCVLVLIWLIINIKDKNKEEIDPTVYNNNIQLIRLGAEKYFFLEKNLPNKNQAKEINLQTMNNKGLVSNIVDYKNRVCDNDTSTANLRLDNGVYILRINLVCQEENAVKSYKYNSNTMTCMNCEGHTYMDGSHSGNIDESTDHDKDETSKQFSCREWSDYQDEKIDMDGLLVRTRTLIRGIKKGEAKEVISYGEWNEKTVEPIIQTSSIEVEQTISKTEVWSEVKTSTVPITNSPVIRSLGSTIKTVGQSSYCASDYNKTSDGSRCVKTVTSDLTPSEYNKLKESIINKPYCESKGIVNVYIDGIYSLVYKNCQYYTYQPLEYKPKTVTNYNYQVLQTQDVTYYRSRTRNVEIVYDKDIYTDYIEENDLPIGYTKVVGSEKVEYSYKQASCEK